MESQQIQTPIIITPDEMRAVEEAAIASGVASAALMEAAGGAVAKQIIAATKPAPTLVLCGPGNNGGDGFVVARKLLDAGYDVRVISLGPDEARAEDAKMMASLYTGPRVAGDYAAFDGVQIIVDGLLGLGISRDVEGEVATLIDLANATPAPVFAIDIPSGVNAATGAVMGRAIEAAGTVTFVARKPGHLLFPGRALCGRVSVLGIGISDNIINEAITPTIFENAPPVWAAALIRPDYRSHKFSRGHAAIFAGPALKTGAARLSALAALRSGAGLATLYADRAAAEEIAAHISALMVSVVASVDDAKQALEERRVTAALIGPGFGVGGKVRDFARTILTSEAGAVIDADAITSFAEAPSSLFNALRPDDVITPHDGEFARLFADIDPTADRASRALLAAQKCGGVVVLKGADTVVAAPDGRLAINTNAPADLATAGSGDVLAGLICGLRAQGMSGFDAACAGVWLHGAAGQVLGPGLIADDLPQALPSVFRALFAPRSSVEATTSNEGQR